MNCRAIFFCLTLLTLEMYVINGQGFLQQLQNAKTAEEFLRNVRINGRPAQLSDVYMDTSTRDENGEQVYVSGGLILARPDECSPRLTTVEIPKGPDDHNVVYWPKCSRIERCGGCCVSNMLKCYPTRIETVELHVLKTTLPFPGAQHLEWEGPMPVVLERHMACSPICRMSASECNATQTFSDLDCMCRCVHQRPCLPLQVWDEQTCSCRCRTVLYCAPSTFNRDTCQCEINRGGNNEIRYSSDDGDITAQDAANFNEGQTGNSDTTENNEPSTANQPTIEEHADPCRTQFCPPNFRKRVDPENPHVCVCTPPFFYPGRK